MAASGTDDHILFMEHPELPEHWRRHSGMTTGWRRPWVPGWLTDDPGTGRVSAGEHVEDGSISREDAAAVLGHTFATTMARWGRPSPAKRSSGAPWNRIWGIERYANPP